MDKPERAYYWLIKHLPHKIIYGVLEPSYKFEKSQSAITFKYTTLHGIGNTLQLAFFNSYHVRIEVRNLLGSFLFIFTGKGKRRIKQFYVWFQAYTFYNRGRRFTYRLLIKLNDFLIA